MKSNRISGDELIHIPLKDLVVWDKHIKRDYDMNLKKMIHSLKTYGQTTPLIVRKKRINGEDKFEIIDGIERYLAASQINKIKKLHCLVRSLSDRKALLLQALNNSDDDKVSGYDRALAYKAALFEESIKQKDLAEQLGIAKSTLTRRMSFLKIDKVFWDNLENQECVTDTLANEIVVILNKNSKTQRYKHKDLIKKLIHICNNAPSLSKIKTLSREVENRHVIERVLEHNNNLVFTYKDNKLTFNTKILEFIDLTLLLDTLEDNILKQLSTVD